LPLDIISGLLGRALTHDSVADLLARVGMALADEKDFERRTGRPAPDLNGVSIRAALNKGGLRIPEEYTAAEIEAQRRRSAIYSDFMPIANAMNEYARLCSVAERYDLMLRTPVPQSPSESTIENVKFRPAEGDQQLRLLRIVAHELGRTTFRPTLTDTIRLAREPATVDLRRMMDIWLQRLYAGDERELLRIQHEIRQASGHLAKLPSVQTVGRATAIIGVPVAVAEMLLALPPVLGLSIATVGLLANRAEDRKLETYKWATFGGI
jgi:hypothetical protein